MSHTPFTPRSFTLPDVPGISQKTMETHIKLYEGYVKHANLILEKIGSTSSPQVNLEPADTYALGELQRRFAFEFDGMRNHEHYFGALEGGPSPLPADSALAQAITAQWGSLDAFMARFKAIALTRGIGWAMLYHDPVSNQLVTQWVDEQHLGHLTGLTPIIALDVWEHAYLLDYAPADKGQYVDAYLNAINWKHTSDSFDAIRM